MPALSHQRTLTHLGAMIALPLKANHRSPRQDESVPSSTPYFEALKFSQKRCPLYPRKRTLGDTNDSGKEN